MKAAIQKNKVPNPNPNPDPNPDPNRPGNNSSPTGHLGFGSKSY